MKTEVLLRLAKSGNEKAKEELFLQYRPLLISRSMIDGRFCDALMGFVWMRRNWDGNETTLHFLKN